MPAAYPTASDVQALLEAAGLTVSAAQTALLAGYAAAARAEFERRIGRKLLADATNTEYRFDPPTNRFGLLEGRRFADFISVASVVIQPEGSDEETLTIGTDYLLQDYNSPSEGRPYTKLRFVSRRWYSPVGYPNLGSVYVTGKRGFSATIDDFGWSAIRALAAYQSLSLFGYTDSAAGLGGDITQITQGEESISFAEGASSTFTSTVKEWKDTTNLGVMLYMKAF